MNTQLYQELLSDFLRLKDDSANSEESFISIQQKLDALYQEKETISFKKNELFIDYIAKSIAKALESIKRKRKFKEIDFQYSSDLNNYIIRITRMEPDCYQLNDQSTIDFESISELLENMFIPTKKISDEGELEKYLSKALSGIYGNEKVHRQFNVGGFLGLKTDIDVGNGTVGIELKVGHKLGATEMQRLIGQVLYYKNRYYKDRLILLIAGKAEVGSIMNELLTFVNELDIRAFYVKTIKI